MCTTIDFWKHAVVCVLTLPLSSFLAFSRSNAYDKMFARSTFAAARLRPLSALQSVGSRTTSPCPTPSLSATSILSSASLPASSLRRGFASSLQHPSLQRLEEMLEKSEKGGGQKRINAQHGKGKVCSNACLYVSVAPYHSPSYTHTCTHAHIHMHTHTHTHTPFSAFPFILPFLSPLRLWQTPLFPEYSVSPANGAWENLLAGRRRLVSWVWCSQDPSVHKFSHGKMVR